MIDLFDNPRAVWENENLAGTLFPDARPSRGLRVATGMGVHGAVDQMRARHDAREARRIAASEAEESPEEREGRWRDARKKALDDIRHERRMGLPPRDGETMEFGRFPAGPQITITIDPATVAAMQARLDDFAATIRQTFTPALAQAIQAVTAFGNDPMVRAAADAARKHQERQLRDALLNGDCVPPHTVKSPLRIALDQLTDAPIPEPMPATPRRHKRSNGKPPQRHEQPRRERYLPGTRHAGKGGG